MKIEIGEYVRTDRGVIAKLNEIRLGTNREKKIFQNIYELDNGLWTVIDYITKHSKNIIDLVEVGDYVNGYRVVDIMEDMETGEIHLEMTSDYTNEIIGDCTIYNDDIKSIVTKEQFSSIEYKVEEGK